MNWQPLIEYFESIPDNLWQTFAMGLLGTPRCALGHVATLMHRDAAARVTPLFGPDTPSYYNIVDAVPSLVSVNDGRLDKYAQGTPKARILAWARYQQDQAEKVR
jgi:hypothetical protein